MESIKQLEFKPFFNKTDVLLMLNTKGVKIDEDLFENEYLSEAMKNQLILSYLPEVVENPDNKLSLFYSRYYWLSDFVERYKHLFGEDAGLDQQLFKLLGEAEHADLEIDWSLIEEIEDEINKTI